MQKKRISLIASSLLLGAILTGCGGSGSSNGGSGNGPTQNSISGKAADGYLRYATVCLDLSEDGYCQPNEPYALTDVNGSFSLKLTSVQKANPNFATAPLLVYGGQDSDTAEDFIGKLKAPNDGSGTINVTPITTLVAAYVPDVNGSKTQKEKIEAAKAKVATVLGIQKDKINADPIALAKSGNRNVLNKALQVQKAVEKIAETAKENTDAKAAASFEVFKQLAKTLKTKTDATDVTNMVGSASAGIKKALDVNDTTIDNAKNLATVVKNAFSNGSGELNATQISNLSNTIATIKNLTTIPADIVINNYKDQAKEDAVKRILTRLGVSDSTTYDPSALAKIINPTMTLEEMKTALKNTDYSNLTLLIDDKLEKIAQDKEKVIQDQTDAQNAAKPFVAMSLPFAMYELDGWMDNSNQHYEINSNVFGTDNKMSSTDEYYNSNSSMTTFTSDQDTEYMLSSEGKWAKDNNFKFNPQTDNSVLAYGGKFGIVAAKDIQGSYTVKIEGEDNMDLNVTMPQGAKAYTSKYEATEDTYFIDEPARNYNNSQNGNVSYYQTLPDAIAGQCGTNWFMGNENGGYAFAGTAQTDSNGNISYTCDTNATSGKLVEVKNNHNSSATVINSDAGTWEIKTVDGHQILVATPYNGAKYGENFSTNFTVANPDNYGNRVWRGDHEKKGHIETWTTYNQTAIDTIKNVITGNNGSTDNSSTSAGNAGSSNNTTATSFVSGKTITVDDGNTTATFDTNGSYSESGYNGAGKTDPYSCSGQWKYLGNAKVAITCNDRNGGTNDALMLDFGNENLSIDSNVNAYTANMPDTAVIKTVTPDNTTATPFVSGKTINVDNDTNATFNNDETYSESGVDDGSSYSCTGTWIYLGNAKVVTTCNDTNSGTNDAMILDFGNENLSINSDVTAYDYNISSPDKATITAISSN